LKKKYLTSCYQDTVAVGEELSQLLKGGEIIALYGELGAGKTHLVKGIGKGLKIEREITSPTFIIAQIYTSGRLRLIHMDLYRINDFSDMEEIGWYDFLNNNTVVVVEWAEKIEEELKNHNTIKVFIKVIDDHKREIEIDF